MNDQDQIFENSKQLPKKLSIALNRYFYGKDLSASRQELYHKFLSDHAYTALLWILTDGTCDMLDLFLKQRWISSSDLHRALQTDSLSSQMRILLIQSLSDCPASRTYRPISADVSQILDLVQLHLFQKLPRLRLALSGLFFTPSSEFFTGTDGSQIFFHTQQIYRLFDENVLESFYLHMVIHCLFLHPALAPGRDRLRWNLACDIASYRLSAVLLPLTRTAPTDNAKEEALQTISRILPDSIDCSSACDLYDALAGTPFWQLTKWQQLFCADEHEFWYGHACTDWNRWLRLQKSIGTAPSPASNRMGTAPGSRLERIRLRREARYDFRSYLRRFTVTAEEMQLDLDSFDYIPYLYGLQRYQNMPLVEPLEYTEASKVEELVIAIDTSGSCDERTVQQFLAETCRLLTNRQNFFRHMNVHILQCDSMIQDHRRIHSVEDWNRCIQDITIVGRGGTDFTPVFTYVQKLINLKEVQRLKGLLYFTDGDGIYPSSPPPYETAFVFTDKHFQNYPVPDWITPLCLNLKSGDES